MSHTTETTAMLYSEDDELKPSRYSSCSHATDECRTFMRRAADRDAAISHLQRDMEELKIALADANTQTKEIIEIYRGMKLLILILSMIGTVAKWISSVAAVLAILWGLWQFGVITAIANKHLGK